MTPAQLVEHRTKQRMRVLRGERTAAVGSPLDASLAIGYGYNADDEHGNDDPTRQIDDFDTCWCGYHVCSCPPEPPPPVMKRVIIGVPGMRGVKEIAGCRSPRVPRVYIEKVFAALDAEETWKPFTEWRARIGGALADRVMDYTTRLHAEEQGYSLHENAVTDCGCVLCVLHRTCGMQPVVDLLEAVRVGRFSRDEQHQRCLGQMRGQRVEIWRLDEGPVT